MGKFWYPTHWQDIADGAFAQPTDLDHTEHGFAQPFVAAQEDRDRYLEDYLNGPSAGGQRYATVVVAASNSSHHAVADADFVCTGTGDQSTINSAIAALPTGGGRVLLMEGTYRITGGITLNKPSSSLCGMGPGTVISATGGGYIGIATSGGDRHVIADLYFTGTVTNAITLAGYADQLVGCHLDTITGDGVIVTNANSNYIISRNMFRNVSGVAVTSQPSAGSTITDNTILSSGGNGIKITGGESVVTDNFISASGGGIGIQLSGSLRCVVANNSIESMSTGIELGGTDALCQGNQSHGNNAYGIRVIAGANTNVVINNDLKGGGTTAAYLDNGTGTKTNLDGSANNWNRLA